MDRAFASPLTPTPLPRGERGLAHEPRNSVPSPARERMFAFANGEGEGQGKGVSMQRIFPRHNYAHPT
jgi:hypothetical protein